MKFKNLSPLEEKVMEIVWKLGSCSVRDVHKHIAQKRSLAYTTVATILHRLQAKGLLVRQDQKAVVHYAVVMTKEAYGKSIVGSFFSKFFASFGDSAMASFAESLDELPPDKKSYLLKLLKK